MGENISNEMKMSIKEFKIDLLKNGDDPGALIPLLQSAQDSYGYVPEKVINYISEFAGLPAAEIYGVVTFYSQFRLKPLGKYIVKVCEGTACHVNGAKTIVDMLLNELGIGVGETSDDGMFSLLSVACLGCCSLAPVMMINEETFGSLTSDKVRKVLKKYRQK